jgi:DNA-binding IclR family transcriptional regulator
MHGVLERSTVILDMLAAEPSREYSVHELSSALALPSSTVHRLLRDMHSLGWVDQRSRRGGYRIGPRAFALTSQQPYQAAVVQRVTGPMQQLAETFQLPVLLATLRGNLRHTLWETVPVGHAASNRRLQESDDLLNTSGGRLLLALSDRRKELLAGLDLTYVQQSWQGVLTMAELRDELAQVRRQRYAIIRREQMQTMSAAFYDQAAGQWFAIGVFGLRSHWSDERERNLRSTVTELSVIER